MPRGPTRRLRRLLNQAPGTDPRRLITRLGLPTVAERLPAGLTLRELLDQAAHEAALLRHPYIGPEHVRLAAAARIVDDAIYGRLRDELLERTASHLTAGPGRAGSAPAGGLAGRSRRRAAVDNASWRSNTGRRSSGLVVANSHPVTLGRGTRWRHAVPATAAALDCAARPSAPGNWRPPLRLRVQ
jgi:hypothetical protein